MINPLNPGDISLRDLEYVLSVARHLNFSRAAEACLVSQPALSKQIQRLEQQFGTPFFERTKRSVLLTREGEQFMAQARQVLDAATRLAQMARPTESPLAGPFRLGIIASACPTLLPLLLPELSVRFQGLELLVHEGLTDTLIQALKRGTLDAVVAAPTFSDPSVTGIALAFEPFVLAYQAEAFPDVRSPLTVDQVPAASLLLLEDGHCLKDQTLSLCRLDEGALPQGQRAATLETLLRMAAVGLGVAVAPLLAINPSQTDTRLSIARFTPSDTVGRVLTLFHRSTDPKQPAMALLAQAVGEQLLGALKKRTAAQ
jgi:LysR family transcriptional regulator, hydrogen peroxide-inducible genes activator